MPAHPEDLGQHDCVAYDRLLTGANWRFATPAGALTTSVAGPIQVTTTEAARACVLEGLGIGYLPIWHFVDGEVEDGRLIVLLRGFAPPAQPISAVYPSRRYLPPKVRVAIDFFASEFETDATLRNGDV